MANDGQSPSKLIAAGYLLLGAGFIITGAQEWKKSTTASGAGQRGRILPGRVVPNDQGEGLSESLDEAAQRTHGALKKTRALSVTDIKSRVAQLVKLARDGSIEASVTEAKAAILSRKEEGRWAVPPKNPEAEARALYNALTDPRSPYAVRYTRDHLETDQFFAPARTLQLRQGDCDDLASLLAALLISAGQRPEYVIMQSRGAADWSHIFVRTPKAAGSDTFGGRSGGKRDPGDYLYLDASMATKPAGWVAPGVVEFLRTGRPSGITVRAMVIPIV